MKGMAGSHVLLARRAGDPGVEAEDVDFAASLAAYFSKARGGGKVEVMKADVKDLRRPSGGLPGQVTVRRYGTITVKAQDRAPVRSE